MINVSDGSASPEEALDRATEGCPSVFLAADSAKRTRAKRARREEVLPCSNAVCPRDDAAITYSHDDRCFYVVQAPLAGEVGRAQAKAPSPL